MSKDRKRMFKGGGGKARRKRLIKRNEKKNRDSESVNGKRQTERDETVRVE